jgi:hypothetical protein
MVLPMPVCCLRSMSSRDPSPSRKSPRHKLPAGATPEQRFKHEWLMSRVPLDSADQQKEEWDELMAAADCGILQWTEGEHKDKDLQLSVSLNKAWQLECERSARSGAESEWEQAKAAEKYEEREKELDRQRGSQRAKADKLHEQGLVPLHEKVYDVDRYEGGSDVEFEGSDEEAELLKDYGGSKERLEAAREQAEAEESQLISNKLAKQLHKLKEQKRKPVARVLRERRGSSDSSSKQVGTGSKGSKSGKGAQGEKDPAEERKEKQSTAGSSGPSSEQLGRIAEENAKALAALALTRRANPIMTAKTYAAISAAAQQDVLHPREQGFAGSALAPPLPPWWRPFESHIEWP